LFGLVFTLTKGNWVNLLGLDIFDLDLLIILITYLLFLYGQTAAGIFAFGQGFLVDLFSGGFNGLFAFLYLSIFGGICIGSRFVNINNPKGQFIIVFMAVFMKKVVFFIVLSLFYQEILFSTSFLWISGVSVIGTALIAPLIFYLFNHLRNFLEKYQHDTSIGQV